MIVASTIFGLSFLGIVGVLVNKIQHMHKGKAFILVSTDIDAKVQKVSKDAALFIKNAPKVVAHTAAFLALKASVIVYEKAKKKVYPKIAHLVDAVKGRNIPKNKGAVSFFLTKIKKGNEIE